MIFPDLPFCPCGWEILIAVIIFFCIATITNQMYIQEIILDGFKSYAQRTVVSGFDPQFNAITGA